MDGRAPELQAVDEALEIPSPPPIIESAANFIGYCLDADHQTMTAYMRTLLHAGAKTARDAGCETGLVDLLDMEDAAMTERAAAIAAHYRDYCYSEVDGSLAMVSDAYACIAVFCLGAADMYSGDDLEVCRLVATAYADASQVLPGGPPKAFLSLVEEPRPEALA